MQTVEEGVYPGTGPLKSVRMSQGWDYYVVQGNTSDQVIFSGPGVYGGYSVLTVAGGACPITVLCTNPRFNLALSGFGTGYGIRDTTR
jgi:hypothetical protein